ncbi:HAAS signaling domain-containing protein [Alkaliphilus crotonatoxidans]
MNKAEFLEKLNYGLNKIPAGEKQDILYDYEEHFRIGLEMGKTEEEISKALGEPGSIAKDFSVNYRVIQAENTASTANLLRAVLATVSLGFFNLIFILGPFIAAVGVLVAFFAVSASVTIAGILLVFLQIPKFFSINGIAFIFLGIGLMALGLLLFIGSYYLSKSFYGLMLKYLRFNLKIINERRAKNEG